MKKAALVHDLSSVVTLKLPLWGQNTAPHRERQSQVADFLGIKFGAVKLGKITRTVA